MKEDRKYWGKDVLSRVDNAFNSIIDMILNNIKDASIIALVCMIKADVMNKLKEEK